MCTAVSFRTKDHYFGRNLDLDYTYQESVVITPRNYSFRFLNDVTLTHHYAMIGIATIADGYPLYYDATNEFGLSMAGLNFPGNAKYLSARDNMDNLSPFEFIPWVLCQCKTTCEAKVLVSKINLTDTPFNEEFGITPLHWIISDREASITVEPREDGLHIYENEIGILTNSPPFDYHIHNLSNYMNLTASEPRNRFSNKVSIRPYSHGMGAIGLPGDLSSASRFIRAAFTKLNSVTDDYEDESVSQFFHILSAVEQTRGCTQVDENYEITVYSSCCNTDKGIYYYTTYENRQISAVKLHSENLNDTRLYSFPLQNKQQIKWIN